MATATITPSSVTIPNGGSVNVTVNWALNPGTSDQLGHLRLEMDGNVLFDAPIVKQGTPAETQPTIVLGGAQPGQALLSSDVAAISFVSGTTYRLS